MKKLSDEELFNLIRLDNERAITILFDRYKVLLFRQIYQRTRSEMESQEILQNIFISIWKNRKTIIVQDSIRPYLMGAAKKSVMALYARTTKEINNHHLLSIASDPFDYSVEDIIMARELENMLDTEVERMPATMRRIFQLSRKEHISVREIASVLNISEQTVKNNMTIALQRLRVKLSSKYLIYIASFMTFFN